MVRMGGGGPTPLCIVTSSATKSASSNVALTSPLLVNLLQTETHSDPQKQYNFKSAQESSWDNNTRRDSHDGNRRLSRDSSKSVSPTRGSDADHKSHNPPVRLEESQPQVCDTRQPDATTAAPLIVTLEPIIRTENSDRHRTTQSSVTTSSSSSPLISPMTSSSGTTTCFNPSVSKLNEPQVTPETFSDINVLLIPDEKLTEMPSDKLKQMPESSCKSGSEVVVTHDGNQNNDYCSSQASAVESVTRDTPHARLTPEESPNVTVVQDSSSATITHEKTRSSDANIIKDGCTEKTVHPVVMSTEHVAYEITPVDLTSSSVTEAAINRPKDGTKDLLDEMIEDPDSNRINAIITDEKEISEESFESSVISFNSGEDVTELQPMIRDDVASSHHTIECILIQDEVHELSVVPENTPDTDVSPYPNMITMSINNNNKHSLHNHVGDNRSHGSSHGSSSPSPETPSRDNLIPSPPDPSSSSARDSPEIFAAVPISTNSGCKTSLTVAQMDLQKDHRHPHLTHLHHHPSGSPPVLNVNGSSDHHLKEDLPVPELLEKSHGEQGQQQQHLEQPEVIDVSDIPQLKPVNQKMTDDDFREDSYDDLCIPGTTQSESIGGHINEGNEGSNDDSMGDRDVHSVASGDHNYICVKSDGGVVELCQEADPLAPDEGLKQQQASAQQIMTSSPVHSEVSCVGVIQPKPVNHKKRKCSENSVQSSSQNETRPPVVENKKRKRESLTTFC